VPVAVILARAVILVAASLACAVVLVAVILACAVVLVAVVFRVFVSVLVGLADGVESCFGACLFGACLFGACEREFGLSSFCRLGGRDCSGGPRSVLSRLELRFRGAVECRGA
jgi:hypothetical protein